jgi:trimeric autotransporter adhesin
MKNCIPRLLIALTILTGLRQAVAQGTAFTYQGQLDVNGAPANGSFELTFSLYTNSTGGTATQGPITNLATEVSNGLFTTKIDFGADVFTGSSNWLQIGVRTNGSTGAFALLTPLQQILPTPYALYASNAAVAGTADSANAVAAANVSGTLALGQLPSALLTDSETGVTLSGTFSGNGANLTALNANNLSSGTVPLAQLSGITSNQLATATWQQATNLNGGNAALASNVVSGIGITNAFITNATLTNSSFAGNGGGLTNLNASQLSSGVIPLTQLPGAVVTNNDTTSVNLTGTFSGNGANLTSLNADNLSSGTVPLAQLSGITSNQLAAATWQQATNVNGGNAALASNVVSGIDITNAFITNAVITNSTIAGNGQGLTNLDAAELNSGVIPASRLPASVVTESETGVTLSGTFSGNASGLTGLNASQLTSIGNTGGASGNFFVGLAGNATTTGGSNTATGEYALTANTAGYGNTANGESALAANTTGNGNTATGDSALVANTTGYANTATGAKALYSNTNGYFNTANGSAALYSNTNGSFNTANGGDALFFNTSGSYNTANGALALSDNTNGSFNTADGGYALAYNRSGSSNTANGWGALFSNTSGSNNTANGASALSSNDTGSNNTADGANALSYNGDGINNTAVGYNALFQLGYLYSSGTLVSGSNNIALGYLAGYNFTGIESSNIDIGHPGVLGENNIIRIGSNQTAAYIAGVISGNGGGLTNLSASQLSGGTIPLAQLPSAVITNNETAAVTLGGTLNLPSSVTINSGADLFMYSDANGNYFAGSSAGNSSITGDQNTGTGAAALSSDTTGRYNTASGYQALHYNTSGYYNTACGNDALYDNTTGWYNTAIGYSALGNYHSGSNNTATGYNALGLYSFHSGNNNTANGFEALAASGGTNNIAMGYLAGSSLGANESTNIDIGNAGFAGDNYTIRIGDPAVHTNTFIAGVINGNGGGLTNLPSANLTGGANGNFFVGSSGDLTTVGSANTAVGQAALLANTTGSNNTAFGYAALQDSPNGNNNTAVGTDALANLGVAGSGAGSDNIALGVNAGSFFTFTESDNIDIGNSGTPGESRIIRIGQPGTQSDTYLTGVVHGDGSELTSLNASQLTSIGDGISGQEDFFVGYAGNTAVTGFYNTAMGYAALSGDTTGSQNTGIGANALAANSSGSQNTAYGSGALNENTTGGGNTASGFLALRDNLTGAQNTAFGVDALQLLGSVNRLGGSNNIALGYQAGYNFVNNESGNIDIGNTGTAGEN